MKQSTYLSFDQMPVMLTVPDVSNILGISLTNTYELVKHPSFPAIKIGSRVIVPRDKFLAWIDRSSGSSVSI